MALLRFLEIILLWKKHFLDRYLCMYSDLQGNLNTQFQFHIMIYPITSIWRKRAFPSLLLNKNFDGNLLSRWKNSSNQRETGRLWILAKLFHPRTKSLAEIYSRPAFFRQFDGISSLDMEFPPSAQKFCQFHLDIWTLRNWFHEFFLFSKLMRMSLQSKPLVGKGISSLKPRLRLGFWGRNSFANLGLGLQKYISFQNAIEDHLDCNGGFLNLHHKID